MLDSWNGWVRAESNERIFKTVPAEWRFYSRAEVKTYKKLSWSTSKQHGILFDFDKNTRHWFPYIYKSTHTAILTRNYMFKLCHWGIAPIVSRQFSLGLKIQANPSCSAQIKSPAKIIAEITGDRHSASGTKMWLRGTCCSCDTVWVWSGGRMCWGWWRRGRDAITHTPD